MYSKQRIVGLCLVFAFTMTGFVSCAQKQRQSPHDTVTTQLNGATIRVTFGSPAVKGRTIWGELVPLDKPWRGGADEATLFTTDKDISIKGKKLPAGTYSVFVIPSADKWTYIFNSEVGQWGIKKGGVANFDEAKNVLSVTAPVQKVPPEEHLQYLFKGKMFGLNWAEREALVEIQ